MITVLLVVAGLFVAVWLIIQAAANGWPNPPIWKAGLRFGIGIGVVRLAVLWGAMLLLADSGWRQMAGHIVLVIDAVLELSLAKSLLPNPWQWRLGLSLLVVTTSLGLGQMAAYVGSRLRPFVTHL